MLRLLLWVVCFVIFINCEQKEEETLDEEKIVRILADMLIVDEVIVKYEVDEKEFYRNYLKKQILEIHDIDQSRFDSTFQNIQNDLKVYNELQTKVDEYLKSLENDENLFRK